LPSLAFYEFEGKRPSVSRRAFVHPAAVIIGDVTVDAGCYVGAGAVLRGDIGSIFVGKGSNVQENCVLHSQPDHAVTLHHDTHIGHGSILHGCEIHPEVLVGMGGIINDHAVVHSRCLIGAGSLILAGADIPADSLVMGAPAKVVKSLSAEQLAQLRWARSVYQDLARRYLEDFREIPDQRRD
jgi:phenylacetic acid degradation protein